MYGTALSLFEVMSDEIAATKGEITQAAEAKAHAAVVANARAGGANGGALFERPTDEEVEAALKKWRTRRAGATEAADAAKAAAAASARAKLESTASVSGPAAAWAALGDRFTEREFTAALFAASSSSDAVVETSDTQNVSECSNASDENDAFAAPRAARRAAEDVLAAHGHAIDHVESLRRAVADMPAKTGIYRWLAEDGEVLYVGKAKNLRDRTRGYLSPALLERSPRHRTLAAKARSVDNVLTPGGESDALALEARLIERFKPPLNVLLKHAPRPDAALIVATISDEVPRFFVVDAGSVAAERATTTANLAGGGGGDVKNNVVAAPPSHRNRLGLDGVGGRVSPGVVAAAVGGVGVGGSNPGGVRAWLRPTRADAMRSLGDLERALSLRSLAFRARHGDDDAVASLREAATFAAAALDGGQAAEDAATTLDARDDFAAAASIRAAAAPGDAAMGALSALLAEDSRGSALRVDVVAAASEGEHCAVQIVRIRDGTIAGMLTADVALPGTRGRRDAGTRGRGDAGTRPRRGKGREENVVDASGARVAWLGEGEEAEEEEEADARGFDDDDDDDERVAMEVVLGEAAQRALEAYYNVDNGEGASVLNARDVPDAIYTPHALPDPSGLERVVRAAAAAAAAADADASGTPPPLNSKTNKQPRRYVKHGIDLPPGLPTSLASLARANAVESARRTANVVAASRGLARVLRLPISSDAASSSSSDVAIRTIEGVDVSHLAGSSTAASVVSFVDGRADNAGHRRYELKNTAGGGDIAPGDDPAAIYAAVYKRVGSVRSKPLPDLLLIDGGKAQLAAAAEALRARNVEIVNLQGVGVGVGGGQDKRASGDSTRPRVALASLSKGRLSGEESVYVPAAAGENGDGFAAVRVRAGAAEDVGGAKQNLDPGMVLLRLVRDESHAVALGAHRRRRRSALFREMLDASSDDGGLGGGGGGERGGIAVAVAE